MSHPLERWFKPVDVLPQLKEPLSATISPDTIRNVNKQVCTVSMSSTPSRGVYVKVAIELQAKIVQYTSLHGNAAAMCQFSEELGFAIKESSVRSWKTKYQMEKRAKPISRWRAYLPRNMYDHCYLEKRWMLR